MNKYMGIFIKEWQYYFDNYSKGTCCNIPDTLQTALM